MIAKIRHVATHTEHYDKECKFYQTIFGMKQITTGLVDENGKSNPDRGHISDGVIGLALLAKRAGSQSGIDHFGFEVDDVREAVDRMNRFYPDLLHTRALTYVPFAGTRAQDPTGTQFDLSQKGQANVREGYLADGWEQPRWLNHIALRARKPLLATTTIYDNPPFGHTFDRQVDPGTWEPVNFREQRDSWNRVWAFLDWNLDPYNDAAKKADK